MGYQHNIIMVKYAKYSIISVETIDKQLGRVAGVSRIIAGHTAVVSRVHRLDRLHGQQANPFADFTSHYAQMWEQG